MERDVESWLGKQIIKMGGLFYKWVSPGNAGVPDRIVILPGGEIHFVELKTDKGKLSPIQRHVQEVLKEKGCNVSTIYGMKEAEKLVSYLKGVTDG